MYYDIDDMLYIEDILDGNMFCCIEIINALMSIEGIALGMNLYLKPITWCLLNLLMKPSVD